MDQTEALFTAFKGKGNTIDYNKLKETLTREQFANLTKMMMSLPKDTKDCAELIYKQSSTILKLKEMTQDAEARLLLISEQEVDLELVLPLLGLIREMQNIEIKDYNDL